MGVEGQEVWEKEEAFARGDFWVSILSTCGLIVTLGFWVYYHIQ